MRSIPILLGQAPPSTISDAQFRGGERTLSCTNDRARGTVGGHHRLDCRLSASWSTPA